MLLKKKKKKKSKSEPYLSKFAFKPMVEARYTQMLRSW